MHTRTILRYVLAVVFSFGLLTNTAHADGLEFISPPPNSRFTAGETVPITYKVRHNGLAKLVWAKVHLMTEDGYDSGMGTLSTTSRPEWQDTLVVSTLFTVPNTIISGKYVLHVYGSTEQPCESSSKCEGILSEILPVEITQRKVIANVDEEEATTRLGINLHFRKRRLFSGRSLGLGTHGRSNFLLEDGSMDTQKMLYLFSLI